MAREGMLMELDHSKLPVIKELNPDWLDKPYDKGNKYSLPQLLGAFRALHLIQMNIKVLTSHRGLIYGNLNLPVKFNYWMTHEKYSISHC